MHRKEGKYNKDQQAIGMPVFNSDFLKRSLELLEEKLSILTSKTFKETKGWQEKLEGIEADVPMAASLLDSISGAPELKARVHKDLGFYYKDFKKDYDQALEHFQKALALEKETNVDPTSLVSLYNSIADTYFLKEDPDGPSFIEYYSEVGEVQSRRKYNLAEENYQKSLEIEAPESTEKADAHIGLGRIYKIQYNTKEATEHYLQAIKINENLSAPNSEISQLYKSIGDGYEYRDRKQAIYYYNKAIEAISQDDSTGSKNYLASLYEKVAELHSFQDQHKLALEDYKKVLELKLEELPETDPTLADCYDNIGGMYKELGSYDLAKENHQKALEIREKASPHYPPDIAFSYRNIGDTYKEEKQYNLALVNYQIGLNLLNILDAKGNLPDDGYDMLMSLYSGMGLVYKEQSKYNLATANFLQAIDVVERNPQKDYYALTDSYISIADIYTEQNKYNSALEMLGSYSESLNIKEELFLDKNDPFYERVYDYDTDYEPAINIYQKILEIREEKFPDDHSALVDTYNKIIYAYFAEEEYDKALGNAHKALKVTQEFLPDSNSELGTLYDNIGSIYIKQKKFDLALENLNKAIEAKKKAYGENHSEIAQTYIYIAALHKVQGELDSAIQYSKKALEVKKEIYGDNHPEIAQLHDYIAGIYYRGQGNFGKALVANLEEKLDNYGKALEHYCKALDIKKEELGNNHPSIADRYDNIASLYVVMKKEEEVIGCYSKALEIRKKELGDRHQKIANYYEELAESYGRQSKHEEVLKYYEKALEIRKEELGESHPKIAAYYEEMAKAYERQEKQQEAIACYYKLLNIKKEILGEKHSKVAALYNKIGQAYSMQNKYDRAIECHNKALEINIEVSPEPSISIADTYENLGRVYSEQNKYELALEHYYKALEITERIPQEKLPQNDILLSCGLNTSSTLYSVIDTIYLRLRLSEEASEYFRKMKLEKHDIIKTNFDPHLLKLELKTYPVLHAIYSLTREGRKWHEKYGLLDRLLKEKLGEFNSPENLEETKLLAFKYIAMAVVHNEMQNLESLLLLAMKHPGVIINVANKHPDYLLDKNLVRILQRVNEGNQEYQEALSDILEGNFSTEASYDESINASDSTSCKAEIKQSYKKDHDEDDSAPSGGKNYSHLGQGTQKLGAASSSSSKSSNSDSRNNDSQEGGCPRDSESLPSKEVLLSIAAEIIKDNFSGDVERLKFQLEHYEKTGEALPTLAPYVEAAESAYPTTAIKGQYNRQELNNDEQVEYIISIIASKNSMILDEKLAAQITHYLATGQVQETLGAYLQPRANTEAEIQCDNEFGQQNNDTASCTTCAQEASMHLEGYELPHIIS